VAAPYPAHSALPHQLYQKVTSTDESLSPACHGTNHRGRRRDGRPLWALWACWGYFFGLKVPRMSTTKTRVSVPEILTLPEETPALP
jgi:hypothetical protein